MAGESAITVVGNLTEDPSLRFTPGGQAVANFTVAQTPRKKAGEKWVDDDTQWFRVSVWRQYAENVAETLKKGDRVVVTGRLKIRKYTTKEGVERLSVEVDADEVAVSLRYATAKVIRAARGGPGGEGQGGYGTPAAPAQAAQADPWSAGASGAAFSDEPPF